MKKAGVYELHDLKLENDALVLNETIFHNANGYIGIRSNFEEGYTDGYDTIRGSYINGFYDFAEMKQAEKLYGLIEEKQTMLNVVDSQEIQLILDGERFTMFEGTVVESTRRLHMEEGYSARHIIWRSPQGKEVEILIKRMTSFVRLSMFIIEYQVKALNFEGNVTFLSMHKGDVMNYSNPDDPRVAGESFKHLVPICAKHIGRASYLTTDTSKSALRVSTGVEHMVFSDTQIGNRKSILQDVVMEGHQATHKIELEITQGETVSLVKYTAFSDSVHHQKPESHACNELKKALAVPLEALYAEQRSYLSDYWKNASLEIDGDDELGLAVMYNQYQLIQSVGKDEHSNIAAKGLSGEGYEGHFFWDTEMYIMPFFTLTNPKISKNLIEYRYGILDQARENARILGHKKGALFPWRTIMGKECSGYFPAGSAQYHINGDIAYAIVSYYLVTKDVAIIGEKGAEIIFETARLWMDVGNYHEGQFHINDVTGPDEYTCLVNNNYYTNVSAKYNLYWAVKFYHLLQELGKLQPITDKIGLEYSEIEAFMQAEEYMLLPYDSKLKINPQDDSFLKKPVWDIEHTPEDRFPLLLHYHPLYLYRHQVCKQADTVLAHFIFEDAQSIETMHNSFEYYEKVTTHDSSLSTCIYSIMASKLDMKEKAYMYFGDSAKLDLFNTHHNTKDGIHTANMGGNYMAIVYGFAGVRIKETGLHFSPFLPEQWNSYRFKIQYEGSLILITVDSVNIKFELVSGNEKKIIIYGEEFMLDHLLNIRNIRNQP